MSYEKRPVRCAYQPDVRPVNLDEYSDPDGRSECTGCEHLSFCRRAVINRTDLHPKCQPEPMMPPELVEMPVSVFDLISAR